MIGRAALIAALVAVAVAVAACGDDGPADPVDASTADGAVGESCVGGYERGQFSLLQYGGSAPYFFGYHIDRGDPTQLFGALDSIVDGDCEFVKAASILCDPPCGDGTYCWDDDECVAYPHNVDVGTVRVEGIDPPLELEAREGSTDYGEVLPAEPVPGDPLTLIVEGGNGVPGYQLEVEAVAPLVVPDEERQFVEGQSMTVHWEAGDDPQARVIIHLQSDHHGIYAYGRCRGMDTGEMTVPAWVGEELIVAGKTGIGTYIENAYLQRERRAANTSAEVCAAFSYNFQELISVETVLAD